MKLGLRFDSTCDTTARPSLESAAERLIAETVERFELAHQRGAHPVIENYLQGEAAVQETLLLELIHTDFEYRIKRDAVVRVEEYLVRYPTLFNNEHTAWELIAVEWEIRHRVRDECDAEMFASRFPQFRSAFLQASRTRALESGQHSYDESQSSIDRFQLVQRLGSGSFGTVWKAFDPDLRRFVAVKILVARQPSREEDLQRLLREAHTTAKLRHPGIVPLFESGRSGGQFFLVSAYIEGMTLAELIQVGPVASAVAANLVAEVGDALSAAHGAGVVHRDVKSSNILLDSQGRPHIIDFGLAKLESVDATLTTEGQLLGTPAYMAPEQALGKTSQVDARSDIYSLGVVLYELLAGRRPFTGDTQSVLRQTCEQSPPSLRQINPRIPRDLETICLKALAKEPKARYPTALAMADDLRRFLAGQSVTARPLGAATRLWRWSRREPSIAILVAVLIVVTAAGMWQIVGQWRQAEKNREIAQANLRRAQEAVEYFTQIINRNLDGQPDSEQVRRQLLERALVYFEDFASQVPTDVVSQRQLAAAYYQVGSIRSEIDSPVNALAAYQRALEIREHLNSQSPVDSVDRRALAESHYDLGNVWQEVGDKDRALTSHQSALRLRQQLASDSPGDLSIQHELVWSYLNIGQLYAERKDLESAELTYRHARHVLTSLNNLSPRETNATTNEMLRRDLAVTCNRLGVLLGSKSKAEESRQLHREALDILVPLCDAGSVDAGLTRELAATYHDLGLIERETDLAAALEHFEASLRLREELVHNHPAVLRYTADLGHSHIYVGQCYLLDGMLHRASAQYTAARDIHERLRRQAPSTILYQIRLAQSLEGAASVEFQQQDFAAAHSLALEEREQWEAILLVDPSNCRAQQGLAGNELFVASALRMSQAAQKAQ